MMISNIVRIGALVLGAIMLALFSFVLWCAGAHKIFVGKGKDRWWVVVFWALSIFYVADDVLGFLRAFGVIK